MKKLTILDLYSKKARSFLTLILILALAIWTTWANRDYLGNFQFYYLKSYRLALEYRVGNLLSFFQGKETEASVIASTEALPVLTYHGIIEGWPDSSNVSITSFSEQMFALKKAGYETVSMKDYYDYIYHGKKLPAKSFLLTFDDGRRDTYYPVDPILEALDFRATMFVITDESLAKSSKFYLSKKELQKMQKSGHWDIEVHTKAGHSSFPVDTVSYGHFYANKLYLDDQKRTETDEEYTTRIKSDLEGAKKDLKDNLGIESLALAFPYGDIGEDETNFENAKKILLDTASEIFPLSFYQYYPGRGYPVNIRGSKTFLNNRIMVDPQWSTQKLLNLVTSSEDKILPYTDIFYKDKGWLTIAGNTYFEGNTMILKSSGKNNIAINYLNGSLLWKNYSVSADFKIMPGATAQLYLNRQDSDQTVSCIYTPTQIRIEETINGVSRTVASTKITPVPGKKIKVGATVLGNNITCFLDGEPKIASVGISGQLNYGGIGFEVWSLAQNNWLEVQNLEVRPLNY